MSNLGTVQKLYAAFGQGDIPTILEHLAEDIDWDYAIRATEVPWLQPRHGRDQVPKFFEALGAVEFQKFEPKTFFENEDFVVVLLDVEMTVKATGQRIAEEDEVHIWHFNSQGLVDRFAHKLDTHQTWLAYRGKTADET